MPLPMIHLAIAVRLGAARGCLPSADFLLGSIAPDSIHMRSNISRADKSVTHLYTHDDWTTLDHAVLRDLVIQHTDAKVFRAGYAAHILTDWLWVRDIIPGFRAQTQGMDDAALQYYTDTDQVDFNLYNHADWRPKVWRLLESATAPEFPPLLTAAEIHAWNHRTLRWFEELKNEPHITPQHITDAMADDFINAAVDLLLERFALWGVATI